MRKKGWKIGLGVVFILFLYMLLSCFVYALDRSPHRVPNIGDFNNDGKNDFVLNGLYMKHNDTLFYDMTSYSLGIENKTNVSYGFFFDYDGDGDLDIYLVFENEPNRIYKAVNPSDYDYDLLTGVNENVTGNSTSPLGANAYDLNNDGCTDLYANNRLFYSNCDGTFDDVSEQSNLDPDDLPRLKQVIFSDVNYDGLVDFIALSEDNQILLYLNQNDTNNDGIVEFWDATEVSRLKNWTENLDKINWIDAYWMHDGDLVPDYFSFGIYIARDGPDKLLISEERAPDLPYFEDYSDEANITQNYNTTCAYFYDFGNENFTDIFVSYDEVNSSILIRNGTVYQYRYARFDVWNETWIFCFAGRFTDISAGREPDGGIGGYEIGVDSRKYTGDRVPGTEFNGGSYSQVNIQEYTVRIYLKPRSSSAYYCRNATVEIWVSSTEKFQSGQIRLVYDDSCADVVDWERNTATFPHGSWDSSTPGEEWITFSRSDEISGTYKVGTLKIHCENAGGCITILDIVEKEEASPEERYTALFDGDMKEIPTDGEDGDFTCKVDTTPPNITGYDFPTCTWYNSSNITIKFHYYDNMAKNGTCKVYVDGELKKTVTAKNCTDTLVNITGLSDGHHNISVVCNDSAGNIYALPNQTIHVDTTPPTGSTIKDPTTCTWFNKTTINVTIHAKDNLAENLTYNITVDGETVATGNATNCTPIKVPISVDKQGHHNISVIFTDQAGNSYTAGPVTIHVDTTSPNITDVDFPTCTTYSSSNITIKFHYYDNMAKNGTCKVYVDGKLNQTVIAKNCTNTSVNITGLSEGDHNISVVCNDSAGNVYALPNQTIHIVFPPTERRGGGRGGVSQIGCCHRYNDNMEIYSWIPRYKCDWYGGEVINLDKTSCTLTRTSEKIPASEKIPVTGSMLFVPPSEAPVGKMPIALVGIAEVRSMELGIGGGVLSFIFNWIAGWIT